MKINQKLQGVNISTINQKTIHAQYFNNIWKGYCHFKHEFA
jgi:hypothetical protein